MDKVWSMLTFHNVYMYLVIRLQLNYIQFLTQLYLNKAGRKMTFEEGLNVFKYFLSQVYKNGKMLIILN